MKILTILLSAALARGCGNSVDNVAGGVARNADFNISNNMAGVMGRATGKSISRAQINDSIIRQNAIETQNQINRIMQKREIALIPEKNKAEEIDFEKFEKNLVKQRALPSDSKLTLKSKKDILQTLLTFCEDSQMPVELKTKLKNLYLKELGIIEMYESKRVEVEAPNE